MKPLRVLYCVGSLNAGGLERFVTRLTIYAKQNRLIEPVVICLFKREGVFLSRLEAYGIPVIGAPNGWTYRPTQFWELVKLFKRISPDVIHSQVNFSMLQQFLAAKASHIRTFCVTERNTYEFNRWGLLRRRVQFHLLLLLGAHYSANGKAVARHLEKLVKARADTIPVLPNGVDFMPSDPLVRARIRALHRWGDNDIVIGYVSRFAAHKGHLRFLEIIARLRHHGLPVSACLVGDGPQRTCIKHRIDELDIKNSVVITGIVSNVEEYYQAFDIVSLLSEHEGMPNVILEAMAFSKPIIATDVGAVHELLDDGRAGKLIRNLDSDQLVELFTKLIIDSTERKRLGDTGRKHIEALYNIEAVTNNLLVYYNSISDRN